MFDLFLLGLLAAFLAVGVSLGCLLSARWALWAKPLDSRALADGIPPADPAA